MKNVIRLNDKNEDESKSKCNSMSDSAEVKIGSDVDIKDIDPY